MGERKKEFSARGRVKAKEKSWEISSVCRDQNPSRMLSNVGE